MSWDFSMVAPLKADGGFVHIAGYDANYTYNVSPMFRLAFGQQEGIRCLHLRQGKDCTDWIDAAIKQMRADPDSYRALNPPNGWGNYEGALELLVMLSGWCHELPKAQVFIG